MTTMLDKCAVAGDITQGIDRRGVWTCAITVIGGTSGTAVKLVSSDTVNGEYTDYKVLISSAEAATDQYKGFVVDLHGAKKFIKVTGAVMATAVFGDCDHDVKAIAITEGEVPSGADLENNKAVSITENGVVEITPTAGKDGMKKVTATVNVSGGAELEDNKTATIDVSTYTQPVEVTPSEGKDGMKKATITLSNIPSGGSATAYAWSFSYNGELIGTVYLDFDTSPIEANDNGKIISVDKESGNLSVKSFFMVSSFDGYTRNSDTSFTLFDGDSWVYTRDSTKDFTLWQLSE